MELIAYIHLYRKRVDITYWRTKTGLEVDFVLGNADVSIEVKISSQVHKEDLKGLIAMCDEHPHTKAIVVSQDEKARALDIGDGKHISILPWKEFLNKLWDGKII